MSRILIDYEESAHNKVQTFEDLWTDYHRVLLSGSNFFFRRMKFAMCRIQIVQDLVAFAVKI